MAFEFDFTLEKFKQCVPNNISPVMWHEILVDLLPRYDITTPTRVAGFIAQCQHDSQDFNMLQDNLNFSSNELKEKYPRHFPIDYLANKYARHSAAIANRIYANMYGNGEEVTGDGWRFRSRGLMRVLGRENYTASSTFLFKSDILVTNPDLLLQPEYAVLTACWAWKVNNLFEFCDNRTEAIENLSTQAVPSDSKIAKWLRALDILES